MGRNVDACPVDRHLRLWQKVKLSASAGLNLILLKLAKSKIPTFSRI